MILYACEDDAASLRLNFGAGDTFAHAIPACIQGDNYEHNCTEFFFLLEDNRADFLVGGGDIVDRGTWLSEDGKLIIYRGEQKLLAFQPIHKDTLLEIDSSDKWVRSVLPASNN